MTDSVDLTEQMAVFESRSMDSDKNKAMEEIKLHAADLLRRMDKIVSKEERNDASRLMNIARTNLEQTVMWAVKAISRK